MDKLHEVLAVIGIPRDEFYELEEETDDQKVLKLRSVIW